MPNYIADSHNNHYNYNSVNRSVKNAQLGSKIDTNLDIIIKNRHLNWVPILGFIYEKVIQY